MISYEIFCRIKQLHEQGLSNRQIAREIGIDPRTVKRSLDQKQYQPRESAQPDSKLDPFKDAIVQQLEMHPSLTAVQIHRLIKEDGFDGGYTIVKQYVRKIRPSRKKAFLTLNFAPGECAQVDWGTYGTVPVGETQRRLHFFVMVLCYCRMMYVEFTVSMTMEHFLGCHVNAFEAFGGAPKKVMVDNLKSAVLKRITGEAPVFNPKYVDFASHYGFEIAACGVGKGNEKGRVENGVKYVKTSLLNGFDIHDFSIVNPAARHWLDTVANVRIHGETKKKPVELFVKERSCLQRLPDFAYDTGTISQVRASKTFRVTLDTNRYSVPAEYAGERLTMKSYTDRIRMYYKEKCIARHTRCYDRHQDIEDPDHPKELLAQRRRANNQKILMRFLKFSPKAQQYYEQLAQRRMNPQHHIRKIVALSEIYGTDAVASAMEDAFIFGAFSSEYVANLLEQRQRILPQPGALHLIRKQDMLDLKIEKPDLTIYNTSLKGETT